MTHEFGFPPATSANGNTGKFVGEIWIWGGLIANVPAGSILCNGAAISRANFPNLFAAIGTVWGAGDGLTTFNVPDYRNIVVAGANCDAGGQARTNFNGTGNCQCGGSVCHSHSYSGCVCSNTSIINVVQPTGAQPVASDTHNHQYNGTTCTTIIVPPFAAGVYVIRTD